MTRRQYDRLWTTWEPSLRDRYRVATDEERVELYAERYGLFAEEGASMPVGLMPVGARGVTLNCLLCHSRRVDGELVVGPPNPTVDLTMLLDDLSYLRLPQPRRDEPRVVLSEAAGTINAFYFLGEAMAHRDEDLRFTLVRRYASRPTPAPSRPGNWVEIQFKDFLYSDGHVPVSGRALMQFALGARGRQKFHSWEPQFEALLEDIEHLGVPHYRGPLDASRVREGRALFERECSGCHGHYGPDGEYPGRVIPIDVVGTDDMLLHRGITRQMRAHYRDSWFGDFGQDAIEEAPVGYLAPPLHGIWVSGPYFHNGSVPTLEGVLDPEARPRRWRAAANDRYDVEVGGLVLEAGDCGLDFLAPRHRRRRCYDTSMPGHDNRGHRFAADLDPREREAILEYLKTL